MSIYTSYHSYSSTNNFSNSMTSSHTYGGSSCGGGGSFSSFVPDEGERIASPDIPFMAINDDTPLRCIDDCSDLRIAGPEEFFSIDEFGNPRKF